MNREYVEVLVEQNVNGKTDTSYVYGVKRLSLDRFDGSTGYYLYDPRGSVVGITNEEGQIYQSYCYSATGEITFGAPQYENKYTYNGESYNPNIESQYLRARYYNVVIATFLTEDSYLGNINEPLTLNRYNYCVSSYLNYQDPSGNFWETILDALSFGDSFTNLVKNPFSLSNWGYMIWDGVSVITPYAPGSYVVKSGKALSKVAKAGKVVSNVPVPNSVTKNVSTDLLKEMTEDVLKRGDDKLVKEGAENIAEAIKDTTKKVDVPSSAIDNVSSTNKTAVKESVENATDAKAVSNACEGSTKALSGQWKTVNESMSDFSRAYQKQITGQEGMAWVQKGVKFDGMKDGVLLDAKGKYAQFINKKTGEFYEWFSGKDSLIAEARRQIDASEGAKIQWYFAEEESLNVVQDLFMDKGITEIELIFEAPK